MYITVKLMLKLTNQLENELLIYERAMKHEIYKIAGVFTKSNKIFEFKYKYISNNVSWNSKSIVLKKAKEYYMAKPNHRDSIMSFSSMWSSRSYTIDTTGFLVLELGSLRGKENLTLPFYVNEQQIKRLNSGTLKEMVIKKNGEKWVSYVCVEIFKGSTHGQNSMGIDIGIKVPAVVYVSDGSIKFFGNGREIRFYQRSYRKRIQMMQKHRRYHKLKVFEHRLSHILKNFDHQISKQIIQFACEHNVGLIAMERLTKICKTFEVDLYQNIYLWSYRRLQTNIAYKAFLSGIEVVYVNPYNTSRKCPICFSLNHANDRMYKCKKCGYSAHRDVVGAINILHTLDS